MNIHEQLESLLANLGVTMEQQQPEPYEEHEGAENEVPEVSIFQASRDHYGVFYRLDIIEHEPQLRIIIPVEYGALKMEVYLVRLSERTGINTWFRSLASYRGSTTFERNREASLQHLLYAVAEIMKQLFWAGDLDQMRFPPEIEVIRLV
ncbi:MAG: hypothetical protein IRZ31_15055 [Thermogemmatispora sp.]|uniref:hypothetical protein n=1 Tax=Thermogemmatispora sp. TaxID=1968838 RepID=UPI002633B697|nr:hypothetical protein [Thermogemmatispora sp.]MBX5458211.1 hypothetical protein [Thermogemmatispora sp.]